MLQQHDDEWTTPDHSTTETEHSESPFDQPTDDQDGNITDHYTDNTSDRGSSELQSTDIDSQDDNQFRVDGLDEDDEMDDYGINPRIRESTYKFINGPQFRQHLHARSMSTQSDQSLQQSQHDPLYTIMQWNVGGIHKKSAYLHQDLHEESIAVAMIQEPSVHYKTNFQPVEINGYISTSDKWFKTSIYYRDDIPAITIPLRTLSNGLTQQDKMYATAIVVPITRKTRETHLLLINVYRPPTSKVSPAKVHEFVEQSRKWLKDHRPKIQFKDYIIGGDLNASHKRWGAQRGTNKSNQAGKRLNEMIFYRPDIKILNEKTKSATRFRVNHNTRKITHSWIDLTLCNEEFYNNADWWVRQMDRRSDHYQIFIQFDASCRKPPHSEMAQDEEMWNIKDTPDKWEHFTATLEHKWGTKDRGAKKRVIDMRWTERQGWSREDRMESIAQCIQDMYHETAQHTFGRKIRQRIWKKWIPKRAQLHAIVFHNFYKRFIKKRRRTATDFKMYKAMRNKRDYWMSYYKKIWLGHKFRAHGIQGRAGWQIGAESRGINDCRGRDLPTTVDPDTGETLAETTREKVNLCNPYYHRFGVFTHLKESWCFRHPGAIPGPAHDYRKPPYQNKRTKQKKKDEDDQIEEDYEQPPMIKHTKRKPGSNESKEEREDRYTDWIANRTTTRWRRCAKRHKDQLNKLNAEITKAEVIRAIGGFSNNKAQGPDEIDIKFIKKTGQVSVDILFTICNIMFYDWQMLPSIWKERTIRPLIKAGKKGTFLKELRPVSLTSYIGKIIEKILVHRLCAYVIRLQLLATVHFGYLKGRSTHDSLTFMIDRIQRNFNSTDAQARGTHTVYFDFSSAFDTVQHHILVWKLQNQFFITGPFLEFIKHFLSGRRTRTKICGIFSEWLPDIAGVPQGGALSPLLYLLYVDDLGILNDIENLNASIFADDLALLTYGRKDKARLGLQDGIYYTQWYCRQHGLIMNHDKTEYKVFRNKDNTRSGTVKDKHKLQLKLDGALEPSRSGEMIQTAERDITYTDKPIKYLGVLLDTRLTFAEHAEYVRKKVHASWYPVQRNLQRLWHIPADIAWTIYDACSMSIFDYSSIIWPMMRKKDQQGWERLYNKIMKNALGAIKGTSINAMALQLGAYPLRKRMDTLQIERFTRMLRTPRSGQIWRMLYDDWQHELCADPSNGRYVPPDKLKEQHGTIIWQIIQRARQSNKWGDCSNDDMDNLRDRVSFLEVPSNLNHSLQLLNDWDHVESSERSFTDDYWLAEYNAKHTETPDFYRLNDIMIFTDGSVEERVGGYGSYIIPETVYAQLIRLKPHDLKTMRRMNKEIKNDNTITAQDALLEFLHTTTNEPLSTRCSIDFCEARAIYSSLIRLHNSLEEATKEWRAEHGNKVNPILNHYGTKRIRIISDSKTVIKWIAGEYTIRHPKMRELVKEIRWNMEVIKEQYNVSTTCEWTRSHTGKTLGNDMADDQARLGRLTIDKPKRRGTRTKVTPDHWHNYGMRAVLNRAKSQNAKTEMEVAFHYQLEKTEYATLWKKEAIKRSKRAIKRLKKSGKFVGVEPEDIPIHWRTGIKWNDKYKKELPHISRDVARIIFGMRTGKNPLNWYLHNRLQRHDDGQCACKEGNQDCTHLIKDCQHELVAKKRTELQIYVRQIYLDQWYDHILEHQQAPRWNPREIDLSDPMTYLFPPDDIPMQRRKFILRATANFFRWVMGYNKRQRIQIQRMEEFEDNTERGYDTADTDSEVSLDRNGIG